MNPTDWKRLKSLPTSTARYIVGGTIASGLQHLNHHPNLPNWGGKHNTARTLAGKAKIAKRKAARSAKCAKRLSRRKRVRAQ